MGGGGSGCWPERVRLLRLDGVGRGANHVGEAVTFPGFSS